MREKNQKASRRTTILYYPAGHNSLQPPKVPPSLYYLLANKQPIFLFSTKNPFFPTRVLKILTNLLRKYTLRLCIHTFFLQRKLKNQSRWKFLHFIFDNTIIIHIVYSDKTFCGRATSARIYRRDKMNLHMKKLCDWPHFWYCFSVKQLFLNLKIVIPLIVY